MQAHEFKQAFLDEWQDRIDDPEQREEIISAFQNEAEWTTFMQGDDVAPGFLHSVGESLERSVYMEQFTFDCVFCLDEPNLLEGDGGYPAGYDVVIEHENRDPEGEWWKLLIIRAPLKVVIFYDWTDEQKLQAINNGNWNNANWLIGKLERFAEMRRYMQDRWPGRRDHDDYLIVVGCTPLGEDLPHWRWL